ncbi:MAG: hypothetical protein JNG89_13395 [Planctomycetaceae bacterium]|nr:hypothetical protein [Planctomycetaceae bacterium]
MLTLAGCYSPMYSQPYGQPYGQPAYPGTMAPGGTYYPGAAPGATLGTPTYSNPSGGSGVGGDAPFYGSPSSSTQNRPVPDYPDGQYYPNGASGSSGFGTTASPATETFEPPISTGGASEISLTREVNNIADEQYAYDTAGHRWVQGVVSFDPRDKSWGIVYSIDPQADDPHNGYLTLADDPRLASLKDGDVVRLDGEVDPTRLDYSNQPSFVVRQITPMSR